MQPPFIKLNENKSEGVGFGGCPKTRHLDLGLNFVKHTIKKSL